MRLNTSVHSWLSVRVRLACAAIFVISMFLPPYSADIAAEQMPAIQSEAEGQFLLAEEGFLLKTSPLTEQGTRSAYSKGILHTVEKGDTILNIARSNGITVDTVRWANGMGEDESVQPGQKLLILPVDGVIHKVKRGQNLSSIAELYGVPTQAIADQNNIEGSYLLAGQDLIIPGGKPVIETPKIAINLPPGTFTLPGETGAKPPPPPSTQPGAGAVQAVTTKPPQEFTITPTEGIFQTPCDCFYTQYFGSKHFGVDMQHKGGSPIFAAEAGTVIRADYGWNGGYGNVIEIDHGNDVVTLYAHNKELYVKKGDTVTRGQAISFMGNTGLVHGPTGIHLHFEVHVKGVKKNPTIYFAD